MNTAARRTLVPLALAFALLSGCSAIGASVSSSGVADGKDAADTSYRTADTAAAQTDAGTVEAPQSPVDLQQITRSATVAVVVQDAETAATRLKAIAGARGGLVTAEDLVIGASGSSGRSTVVLSVPADQLDGALADITGIGEITSRTIQSTDVTTKVADVDARISTMRESIARIRDLLTKAGSVAEISQVESELTTRQSALESLLAQQKALAQRVAMSPVAVTLSTVPIPVGPEPRTGFLAGLSTGWSALTTVTVGALTVVGTMLPFLLLIAMVALPVVWVVRRHRLAAAAASKTSDSGESVS